MGLIRYPVPFPAQAVGDGQIGFDFPGVLKKGSDLVLAEVQLVIHEAVADGGEELGLVLRSDQAQQSADFVLKELESTVGGDGGGHILDGGHAIGGENVEVGVGARRKTSEAVRIDVTNLSAPLEAVRADDFGHAVVPLEGALLAALAIGIAERLATETAEDRQSEIRAAPDAVNELGRNAVEGADAIAEESLVDAVSAEAEFVNESGTERGSEPDGEPLDLVVRADRTQIAGKKITVAGIRVVKPIKSVARIKAVVLVDLVVNLEYGIFIFFPGLAGEEQ